MDERGPYSRRAIRILRLCLIAAVAIIGSMILDQLEPHPPEPMDLRISKILGGASAPFIVAVIPAVLIRSWLGLVVGFLIIYVMDYIVAQGILHSLH